MNRARLILGIIIIEIIILVFAGIRAFRPNTPIDISLEGWTSELATEGTESGLWSIYDSAISENENHTVCIDSPFFMIDKGEYRIDVIYDTDDIYGDIILFAGQKDLDNVDNFRVGILPQKQYETIEFEAYGPVNNASIELVCNNSGTIKIDKFEFYKTRNPEKRFFVIVLVGFLLIDVFFIFKKTIIEHHRDIIIVICIGVAASLPLFAYGLPTGHDLDFHLMRIEGIRAELLAGHFPVRMQSIWNWRQGYPVSIYYGDFLLYIPAILRILGFNVLAAYKLFLFIINIATAFVCYYAGLKIWNKNSAALVFAAGYTLSTYRYCVTFVGAQIGAFSAMLFLPLLMAGIHCVYNDNCDKVRAFAYITIAMSGIICSHVLTTEIACCFLCGVVISFWKRNLDKRVIGTFACSIIATGLITAFFTIPFLDYYLNVPVKINNTVGKSLKIQDAGAFVTQYFAVFGHVFGGQSDLITERSGMAPGLILMLTLAFAGYLLIYKKVDNFRIKKLSIGSILLLFVASNLFPWNWISQYKIGKILCQIQFPTRWLCFACLVMALLIGEIVCFYENEDRAKVILVKLGIIIVSIFQVFTLTSNYSDEALEIKDIKYYYSLSGWHLGEYVRADSDFNAWVYFPTGDSMKSGRLISSKGNDYIFKITMNDEGDVILPISNYKGYKAWDDYGNAYTIADSSQKQIMVHLDKDFDGNIHIAFIEPRLWRLAELMSFISLILFCIYFVYKRIINTKEPIRKVN